MRHIVSFLSFFCTAKKLIIYKFYAKAKNKMLLIFV